jgi:hypothetical protein
MANQIDLVGAVTQLRRIDKIMAWYGQLFGTVSDFNMSFTAATPSTGPFFSGKDWNEILISCVAQAPGASYANTTGLTVLLQEFVPSSQDFITIQTLAVGALGAGPAGNGTGTYSFGAVGAYTNFGDLLRIAVYGTGSTPTAGYLKVNVTLKG